MENRIKKIRLENGVSQKVIAAYLDVPVTTYASYEQGKSQPSSERLIKLADYFNVSVDYLLGRTPYKRPTDDPSLVWGYVTPTGRELTPEEQEEAKKFIDMMVRAHDAENQDK
ncbi:helix-turn-helix domain-containing protein [Christensenella sp. MSJ-20]|uniref:helix-turn-helix domain-containing protein n=1 Tax=Christensenella sp. MSJ-20 TaxID=2841518 RepID=UPI001C757124|nr:helix-turn-helix domain-containing protein [Christensenella sp. MSJ-20]